MDMHDIHSFKISRQILSLYNDRKLTMLRIFFVMDMEGKLRGISYPNRRIDY